MEIKETLLQHPKNHIIDMTIQWPHHQQLGSLGWVVLLPNGEVFNTFIISMQLNVWVEEVLIWYN